MDDPAALAQAFKLKAATLRDLVQPHLRASPELQLGMEFLEMMPAGKLTGTFAEYVAAPYSHRISARDAAFFLTQTPGQDHPVLAPLRASWADLPADTQGDVWALLALLCGLSKRYARFKGA